MQTKITVTGVDKVQAFLKRLPFLVRQKAAGWVSDYLIGDDTHGLKHYPAYRTVSRMAAYGKSFFTDRQRRWFFWAKSTGQINPGVNNRTGAFADAWDAKPTGGGGYKITNDSPYAQHLAGTTGFDNRARQPAMVGWRWLKDTIASNLKGAFKHAQAEVKKWAKTIKP